MTKKIVIEPVTRLEGHGKVTIHLNERGNVDKTRFHVTQVRGFEKFCEGRLFWEMPVITPRICGICPVSHHLASAKAEGEAKYIQIVTDAQVAANESIAESLTPEVLQYILLDRLGEDIEIMVIPSGQSLDLVVPQINP